MVNDKKNFLLNWKVKYIKNIKIIIYVINGNFDKTNWKKYKKLIFTKSDYFRFSVNNIKRGRVVKKLRFERVKTIGRRFYWFERNNRRI